MSAVSDFESGLKAYITQAWPEVFGPSHPILRVTQAERRAWRSLFEKRELESPWVVVQTPPLIQAVAYGACNEVYDPLVTVHYVTDTDKALSAGYTDVAAYVHAKLDTLSLALKAVSPPGYLPGEYTGFQLWWGFRRDVSETNPVNQAFLSSNLPIFGGSLSFQVLFGEIPFEAEPVP